MSDISFGRYQIRGTLGRGAMGVVYEAHDPARGIDVALKVLVLAPNAAPEARKRRTERFYREARALSELSHPRVPHLFDQGELEGRCYFSMELVRGTTLRDRLAFTGPLSLPELIRLATELCDVLEHLHSHGVVHRDVKPENIMLMPDGSSKLMDFGVAQVAKEGEPEPVGGFHGSPAYMSPEQVAGQVVDGRSDIYSLAVTLYEAATGRRAVEGDTLPVITHRITHEYPPAPAGLPPYFQAALLRALAKNPAYRYRYAADMAADLREGKLPSAPFDPGSSYVPPTQAPRAPVLLGAEPPPPERTLVGAPSQAAPAEPDLSAFALPAADVRSGPLVDNPCRTHARMESVALCGACGSAICYACLLDVPGKGTVCRRCAFPARA